MTTMARIDGGTVGDVPRCVVWTWLCRLVENKRVRDTGGLQRWGGASAGDHGGLLPVHHGGIGSPYPVWHWGLACQRCPSAGCASPSVVALGCLVRGYPCGARWRGPPFAPTAERHMS